MNTNFSISAFIFVFLGAAHSYLGERFILIPLFKRGHLPKIFNSEKLTAQTLRFVWHILTVAWIAFAAMLYVNTAANPSLTISGIIALASFASFIISLTITRGKHFSWIFFLAISILIWLS